MQTTTAKPTYKGVEMIAASKFPLCQAEKFFLRVTGHDRSERTRVPQQNYGVKQTKKTRECFFDDGSSVKWDKKTGDLLDLVVLRGDMRYMLDQLDPKTLEVL